MPGVNFNVRLSRLRDEMEKAKLDSLLVTDRTNVSYLSGFRGDDSVILITGKKRYFITDSRYIEEAEEDLRGFDIRLVRESTYRTIADLVKSWRLKSLGFESMNLPYGVAERLKQAIGLKVTRPVKGLVETVRVLKDAREIELIKKSIRLAKDVLAKVAKLAKPGAAEDVLAKIAELEFINRGAHPAFLPIVASGARSSKPHAAPTAAKIPKDSVVMIDLGCNLNGYNSDITKTLFTGRQDKITKIYSVVKEAQALAIEKIAPGKRASEIDFAARGHIHKNGFGKYFGHSLGHGVGMDVHEDPGISRISETVLRPGMVFTVEPAIYIPKLGGVRIEDMVLVTDKGCEVLTR